MYSEIQRARAGGQIASQNTGMDKLIDDIMNCIKVGDKEDEKMGVDLPSIKFDRQTARDLIQDFMDQKLVGKGA